MASMAAQMASSFDCTSSSLCRVSCASTGASIRGSSPSAQLATLIVERPAIDSTQAAVSPKKAGAVAKVMRAKAPPVIAWMAASPAVPRFSSSPARSAGEGMVCFNPASSNRATVAVTCAAVSAGRRPRVSINNVFACASVIAAVGGGSSGASGKKLRAKNERSRGGKGGRFRISSAPAAPTSVPGAAPSTLPGDCGAPPAPAAPAPPAAPPAWAPPPPPPAPCAPPAAVGESPSQAAHNPAAVTSSSSRTEPLFLAMPISAF